LQARGGAIRAGVGRRSRGAGLAGHSRRGATARAPRERGARLLSQISQGCVRSRNQSAWAHLPRLDARHLLVRDGERGAERAQERGVRRLEVLDSDVFEVSAHDGARGRRTAHARVRRKLGELEGVRIDGSMRTRKMDAGTEIDRWATKSNSIRGGQARTRRGGFAPRAPPAAGPAPPRTRHLSPFPQGG